MLIFSLNLFMKIKVSIAYKLTNIKKDYFEKVLKQLPKK